MENLLEIAKITIPAAIVFVTAYFMIKTLISGEKERREHEIGATNQKITTPLRLKAYERLVLFLERISPNSILPRVVQPQMSAQQLQRELVSTIRIEFEHNLSQQLYVSNNCWQSVVASKENMIKMVNMVAAKVQADKPNASAQDFARLMLEAVMDMNQGPTTAAIEFIRAEAASLFS